MSRVALRTILGPRRDATGVISAIADMLATPLSVEDADGRLLHGMSQQPGGRYPVSSNGDRVGWVSGDEPARAVAALLDHLLAREAERKALGAEVLHLYREVNLIYSFSEKLAALLDLDRVAQLTITEARHLISATDGAVMLLDEATGALSTLAGFGDVLPHLTGLTRGEGVVGAVAASGIAEIVNDIEADPRRVKDRTGVHALLCAPLKVGERVIGVIALGSSTPAAYTAAELKLLNTLALQTATAIENARLFERTIQAAREREALLAANQAMEVTRAKLEREFELAARIQADLFPAALPVIPGYDVAARNRPARRCGGDYYDALPFDAGGDGLRLLFCVADVSGKGMPAALLMSHMQATLRALIGRCRSLPALATQASDLLFASTAANKYVTAAFLMVDPQAGSGRYVSAGHVDCLLAKAGGEAVRLQSTGAPLGLLPPGLAFEETVVAIDPGDCLVLFSDGVADAQNEAGEEFGDQRLLDIVKASRLQPAAVVVDRVFGAIDEFAAGAPQFDDITIMVLQRELSLKSSGGREPSVS
jgi:serine phosphatase RsbU (regulator of sigma subunit)